MRKEKVLTGVLHDVANLIAEESARNSVFAAKLETILAARLNGLPKQKAASMKLETTTVREYPPDIHAEWAARGENDFRLWLCSQPLHVLRTVIRNEDLDAARRTTKWKEAEKLSDFIIESLLIRQTRGAVFMGRDRKETTVINQSLTNDEPD